MKRAARVRKAANTALSSLVILSGLVNLIIVATWLLLDRLDAVCTGYVDFAGQVGASRCQGQDPGSDGVPCGHGAAAALAAAAAVSPHPNQGRLPPDHGHHGHLLHDQALPQGEKALTHLRGLQ
eukprot:scaffold87182_cov22-Prasinocladus_malaysianus.AAC.1